MFFFFFVILCLLFYVDKIKPWKGAKLCKIRNNHKKNSDRERSPELRCGLGRVCPLNSPAWWDGWRNCCWEASRWDGWYRLSKEWRKFTYREKKKSEEILPPLANPMSLVTFTQLLYTVKLNYKGSTFYLFCKHVPKVEANMWRIFVRCYALDASLDLQSQLIAGVSAVHLRAGQAEPPLEASRAFSQTVANWTKDVLVHRDGFSTWRWRKTKKTIEQNRRQ